MKKIFLILLVVMVLLTCGCGQQQTTKSGQRLLISAVADTESFITIPKEDLNGNYDGNLKFQNIKDVTITLDGKSYPLEAAIADCLITVEEIEAYARIDAGNGYCEEIGRSEKGLSHFIYRYPDVCDLYFVHDVYETPDENRHIINNFLITNPYGTESIVVADTFEPWSVAAENYPIDQEDWKLKFEATHVTTNGFTLNIRQGNKVNTESKSQHIGQLYLSSFDLYDLETMECYSFDFKPMDYPIISDSTTSYSVDFSVQESFPQSLPSGSYRMWLCISDKFDEIDVHPLMRDYHDFQSYWIDLEIP